MENWLQKAKEEYESAIECSKKPPQNEREPYQQKYKAKESLETLLTAVSNYASESRVNDLLSALFHYEIGVICLDTEEPAAGEVHLTAAQVFLENYMEIGKYVILSMNIYNQLGILYSVRKDLERAKEYLQKAEALYNESTLKGHIVITNSQLFSLDEHLESPNPDGERRVNEAYAHTLYYLAQVHGNMENAEQAAMYCFQTLKWQIDHKLSYDPLEWSMNAAVLSQYFANKDQFRTARHLLSCASLTLSESNEKRDSSDDCYRLVEADVKKSWGKYGVSLLKCSKEGCEPHSDQSSEPHQKDLFTLLDCDLSHWENQVTDKYACTFEDARSIFLFSQKCFADAKTYYTLNDYASEYVSIVQSISTLYKALTLFETSYERSCKMFKRRADLLEETLNALNIKYYLNTCRQLRFELADIYSEMMDMKLKLKEKHDRKSAQKVNTLIQKSMNHFLEFIESLKEDKALPRRFTDDLVRPALLAHFYVARLHFKRISSDPETQLEYLRASNEGYKFVADYIKENPDHNVYIKEEFDVITDMLKLLPQRIEMLAST